VVCQLSVMTGWRGTSVRHGEGHAPSTQRVKPMEVAFVLYFQTSQQDVSYPRGGGGADN